MDPQEHNAYIPRISPMFTPLSQKPGLTPGTVLNSSNHASPYYASCQNSPFATPQSSMLDPLFLDPGQVDWKSDSHFTLDGGSFSLDTQPHEPSQITSIESGNFAPQYYEQLESENPAQLIPSPTSRPPSYRSNSYLSFPQPGGFLPQYGYSSPNSDCWNSVQQAPSVWNNMGQHTKTHETTSTHRPRKKPKIIPPNSRSAFDRMRRGAHSDNLTDNKALETNQGSAKLRLLPELERALVKQYPHCKTHDDRIKAVIRDLTSNAGNQPSENTLTNHQLNTGIIDNLASPDKWRQIESVVIRTKPTPNAMPLESAGTSHASISQGEVEIDDYDEYECDLESKGEEDDIHQDLSATGLHVIAASSPQDAQVLSQNASAVMSGADQQKYGNVNSQWRFACPFYKKSPHKHLKYRTCAGPGWEDIARLK
jgi:hypothetical protein